MSKLKSQLRVILPKLSEEANRNQDPEVKSRLAQIRAIVNSTKDITKACDARGVSTDFFYEWGGRLAKSKRLESLKSVSRRPHENANQTPKRVEKRIRKLRLAEPGYGPDRLSFYLKKLYNIVCAPSSVYNVLGRLGMISQEKQKRRSKKHLKRYTRPFPGYLQMDVKYVPYWIAGKKYYEFNAVDHCSSWRLIRVYKDKSQGSLIEFLAELEKECPFHILQLQTDNGAEFTDKYRINTNGLPTGWHPLDLWCARHGIEHRLIPIGAKEINGKVENTHGFDDREFYSRYVFESYQSLELNIRGWNHHWNASRHTRKLGWRTPNEVVIERLTQIIAVMLLVHEKTGSSICMDDEGTQFMVTDGPEIVPSVKKHKRLSATDRYLQWMDEDAKKSLKSTIAVPAMSQIFPVSEHRSIGKLSAVGCHQFLCSDQV